MPTPIKRCENCKWSQRHSSGFRGNPALEYTDRLFCHRPLDTDSPLEQDYNDFACDVERRNIEYIPWFKRLLRSPFADPLPETDSCGIEGKYYEERKETI